MCDDMVVAHYIGSKVLLYGINDQYEIVMLAVISAFWQTDSFDILSDILVAE